MKNKSDLASIFLQVEKSANAVEGVASKILLFVRKVGAATVEDFNPHVSEAFAQLNWSQVAGRPASNSTLKPAPRPVKLYLSIIRRAYSLELDVLSFESMGEIRKAVAEQAGSKAHAVGAKRRSALRGVSVAHAERLTGDVWHDALVLTQHLPDDMQAKLDERVRKLVREFLKFAPSALKLVS